MTDHSRLDESINIALPVSLYEALLQLAGNCNQPPAEIVREAVSQYLKKVWSVARQENYQPLSEDHHDRPVFEYENIEDVLACFYTPTFIRALNFPEFP